MKTVWLCGALSLAMMAPGAALAEESAGESGDPHVEVPPPMKRRSTGLMAGGIVLVSVGSIASILGTAALIGQQQSAETCTRSSQIIVETGGYPLDCEEDAGTTIAGAALLAGGLAVLGGGIPMIVIGKQRVPDPVATVSVAPRARGASVGLAFSF